MQHESDIHVEAAPPRLELDALLPVSGSHRFDATISATNASDQSPAPLPDTIARYQIESLLGRGGYGHVFKAFDDQLQRHVAIKVPLRHQFSEAALQKYLDEARTLAKLNHPGIVAVHDVGVTEDGLPFIVSPYIDGRSLAERMRAAPLTLRHGLELLSAVGSALAYVHAQGVVHRDVKPGNILLDREEQPFLADFGLALRDETAVDTQRSRVGTPAYMSPEQARGESHLVDGRSDIFSLGVVLYEMLTGKRPFGGRDRNSIVYSLLHQEVRPPRQLSAAIPRDLERICLKALAKRASDRYSTAGDFVDDLVYFLSTQGQAASEASTQLSPEGSVPSGHFSDVIPRGLRSYDRHDAAFFSRLLPGPRDRQWIPESLRFWQRQIEGSESSDPPRVGVVYGPSGCGKSSFVKAGLLPLLGESVTAIFVEATRDETESRLLRGIRKRLPELSGRLDLTDALAAVRERSEVTGGRRLLIVIDQFEQWLHGRPDQEDSQLATALRQCDGYNIQCLLLVRDDFWLALSRFMAILEVPLRQNHNAMLVDLFTPRHARKVLSQFGAAYDRLPANAGELTADQNAFLDRAVEELSDGGKVFPVRLSLFVEMVKTQPWTIDTLTELGGIHGLGLQFLEETFSSHLAPVAQRTHEPAVRRVLRKLLPEQGVNIKGNMQPESVLLDESGYRDQPALFDEMMRILDNELRLVTPTDPAGTTTSEDSISQSSEGQHYYQLTHDYLVPAIEQWLTRKERETRCGRAELRLAEYASLWSTKPATKYAPAYFDWISIRFWSSPKRWNSVERKMMKTAARRHVLRTALTVACLVAIVTAVWLYQTSSSASALVQQLQTARIAQLDSILDRIAQRGSFAVAPLTAVLATAEPESVADLATRLALLPHDNEQREILIRRSVAAALPAVLLLRERLSPLDPSSRDYLCAVLQGNGDPPQQLRAAIMLGRDAEVVNDDAPDLWPRQAKPIVAELIRHATVSPQDTNVLLDGMRPIARHFTAELRQTALQKEDSSSRSLATSFLVQFLQEQPGELLSFFLDASFPQHDVIMPTLSPQLEAITPQLQTLAFSELDEQLPEEEFDKLARRKGLAAALLHRVGLAESTWPLLRESPWPHVRGYLVHGIAALGGDFDVVLYRFSRETQTPMRRALLLSLGEFPDDDISPSSRLQAIALAKDAFENDHDAGIHSAAQWALLRWGQGEWIAETEAKLSKLNRDPRKNWYLNTEGQTMAVFDAREVPGIGRVFEMATREVTVEEYLRYKPSHYYYEYRSPTPDCPIGMMNWFRCLGYCRWLSDRLNADPDHSYPPELTPNNRDVPCDFVLQHGAYRLPTAAEWQYACAAMTTSRRYYGWTDELADKYYWYWDSSLNDQGDVRYYPAGMKRPNDFGMFAMYDGVREWGHEQSEFDRRRVFGFASSTERERVMTFRTVASDLTRSINGYYGFRLARTVTP
jgi:serine/threonine protein kinase